MFIQQCVSALKSFIKYGVVLCCAAAGLYAAEDDINVPQLLESLPYKYSHVNTLKINDDDAPWIIHITDYHCQYELQQNISKIIYLITNKNQEIDIPVCIEGASGVVETSFLASIPDEKIRTSVSDYFLKKGKISGAEFYGILFGSNQSLIGVDNPDLYNQSYALYANVHRTASRLQPQFQLLREFFNSGMRERLSAESKAIVTAGQLLRTESNVNRFITNMEPFWSRLDDTPGTKTIQRYYSLENSLKDTDYKIINELKKKLFERLTLLLPADQREKALFNTYVRYQLNEVSEPEYLRHLVTLGEQYDILDREYAELMRLTVLLEEFSAIDHVQLLEYCMQTYDVLKQQFLTSDEQQFVAFFEQWNLIEEMCALELPRNDFIAAKFPDTNMLNPLISYVLTNKNQITADDNSERFPVEFYAAFNRLYSDATSFYKTALARDVALANNTVSLMQTRKSPIAIQVTGGFHTDGITRVYDEMNLNYAVINPRAPKLSAPNNYKSIMMAQVQGITQFLAVPQGNRLAPRVLLGNFLSDPQLSQQLMKEAVLMAKLLAITEIDTEDSFTITEAPFDPASFKQQVADTLKAFTGSWLYRLRESAGKQVDDIEYLRKMESLLLRLVLIEQSLIVKERDSVGVTVFDSETETFLHVDIAATAGLNNVLNFDSTLFPDTTLAFDAEERLGAFTFRFTQGQQPFVSPGKVEVEPPVQAGEAHTASISELLQHIADLKEKLITRPYVIRYRVQLNKSLKAVADFLEFAAEQEEQAGNRAQALQLRASALLYRGNTERAQLMFREYMRYLPDNQTNLAAQLFVKNAMMHGQKVNEQITDDDNNPFYDRYGRVIQAHLLDDTLHYGSETSNVTQKRLIEKARQFEEMNELYYSRIIMRSASNLTDENRNYRHTQLNVALMTIAGEQAYARSMLASGTHSYGAYTDTQLRYNVNGGVVPRVSYLYDAEYTQGLVRNKQIALNDDDALSDVSIPASKIAAILVNAIHLPDVLESLADFPARDMPVLDTQGNLLWKNVSLNDVMRKHENAYRSRKKDVSLPSPQPAQYTYVKKIENPERIVAIGDVQSDYVALTKILQNSSVIDADGTLIARPGTAVVINGDFSDKGTGEAMKKTIDLLMDLQQQAQGSGVDIVITMGNHEARFLSGKWYNISENILNDFLRILGLTPTESTELRTALYKNDTAVLGLLFSHHPQVMKYMDFLWNLPIIAQVGGHVFVHAGPTPAFNSLLKKVLDEHKDWSVEQGIEFIFQNGIKEKGFNGALFDDGFDSLLSAAPEWTPPHYIEDQSIVDQFLAFFDGASFLGVGHNKALGVIGQKRQFERITRVGPQKNIIKLDVGVSYAANRNQQTATAKAYIVDPRQTGFVHSLDESNVQSNLLMPSEMRKSFMNSDVAAIYDLILGNRIPLPAASPDISPDQPDKTDDMYDQFYRKVFMIFTPVPGLKEEQFKTETERWLRIGEELWFKTQERIDPIEDETTYKILDIYIHYLQDISYGIIDPELVAYDHFKEYVQKSELVTTSTIITKALHGREIDYKRDGARIYAALHQGKTKPFPAEILDAVNQRLGNIIKQRQRSQPQDFMTTDELLQVKDLLTRRHEFRSIFLLFNAYDGNPGIFLDQEGDGVLGVSFSHEIYFGEPLVMYLWGKYADTGDEAYLDKLAAFIVHEGFEYIHRYRSKIKSDLAELHKEAERLEVVITGKGDTGSKLDDEIDLLIKEWFRENEDRETKIKKQFLNKFGEHLKESENFQQYRELFNILNIPVEGSMLDDVSIADQLFMYLTEQYPNQLFDAVKSLYTNLEELFVVIDEREFTQAELFVLAQIITEKADTHSTVDAAVLEGVFDFLKVTDTPQPKTPAMRQRVIANILRESSI